MLLIFGIWTMILTITDIITNTQLGISDYRLRKVGFNNLKTAGGASETFSNLK